MRTYEATEQAYKSGYEKGKADAMEWISVKERLPERDGAALVCTKQEFYGTKNITKARFRKGEWHGQGGRWTNVTHWMPLPKPPMEE